MAKVEDLESCLKNKIKEIEEEQEHTWKVIKKLKTQIMFPTDEVRSLDDLSQPEIDDLSTKLGTQDLNEPILGGNIPKASDITPEGGPSFRPTGRGNMEPSDDDDEMKTYEGKSSNSGGADDA
ncbi:Uncharacterized protein Rs2_33445 [Raphanus sativus]|nr:Uncharacterized protein Rs2_33445 [Raphanus sativus]